MKHFFKPSDISSEVYLDKLHILSLETLAVRAASVRYHGAGNAIFTPFEANFKRLDSEISVPSYRRVHSTILLSVSDKYYCVTIIFMKHVLLLVLIYTSKLTQVNVACYWVRNFDASSIVWNISCSLFLTTRPGFLHPPVLGNIIVFVANFLFLDDETCFFNINVHLTIR